MVELHHAHARRANTYSFAIVGNTDTMVSADEDADKVQPILDDMAKASTLALTIGRAKPVSVIALR